MQHALNPAEVAYKQELASATVLHLNMVAYHAPILLRNLELVIPRDVQVSVSLTPKHLYMRKTEISDPLQTTANMKKFRFGFSSQNFEEMDTFL